MENIICNFDEYEEEIISIRETVFVKEQSVPKELELDGIDNECIHVLIKDDKKFIATGRIQKDGHIGRVAVLKEYRGKGLGKEVINSLIAWAKEHSLHQVYLGAQLQAVDFYKRIGFKEYGEIFLDAGIQHIHMNFNCSKT